MRKGFFVVAGLALATLAAIALGDSVQQSENCADGTYHWIGFCAADLSSPTGAATGETTGDVGATSDESDGTRYACATSNSTELAASDVEACSGGATVSGNSAAEVGGAQTIGVSGLTTDSAHYGQSANKSPEGWWSNVVVSSSFTPTSGGGSTTVYSNNFDYGRDFVVDGSCRNEDDPDCSTAVFPRDDEYAPFTYFDGTSYDPGATFLVCSGGSNTTNTCAEVNSIGARGGSGRGVQHFDENEYEKGGWGHDLQFLKIFPQEYFELWVQWWVKVEDAMDGIRNQKMLHFFHYDRSWFEAPTSNSATNTSESTDGGTICNLRNESSTEVEIRCGIRHANPPKYKVTGGIFNVTPGGDTSYPFGSSSTPRFDVLDPQNNCSSLADSSVLNHWSGVWRKIDVGMRLNSAIGVADGWLEVWVDDCKLGRVTDIPWKQDGTTNDHGGWNGVALGGNAWPNDWGADEEEAHTWSFDDWKICTERCP